MTQTIRHLMDEQAARLVGRDDEMAVLRRLLGEDGPLVIFIHGIAGIGKSTLVEAFGVEARTAGATVLQLDGRSIEPTPRGFLAALESRTGGDLVTAEDAAARLNRLRGRVIIILDTYELLRLLDPWLRQTLVPALSDNVRVVVSGREPPMTGWRSSLGGLFRGLTLENLPREVAEALLLDDGLDRDAAERVYRLARGHPLSLRLAASALAERPDISLEAVTVKAIIEGLTELYLGILDPRTREALDAASVVRRPTLSLLAAMLPEMAPQDAFDRLRILPFVELSDDGLAIHDTVHEAIAALLRSSDPDRSNRYRVAAWRQLRDEVARASTQDMWRYTADLLYILQNPIVREAFFPTTDHLYSVVSAEPTDGQAIAEIAERYMPPASVTAISAWWRLMPEAFRILRDRLDAVAGFYMVCEIDRVSHRLVEEDPILALAWEHLRHDPVPRGQHVLFSRAWLSRDFGEAPSPVQAASWLDIKRLYMDMRPNLRRIYSIVQDVETFGPMVGPLGFELIPDAKIDFDGVPYYATQNDFGPSSIDGWLARLVAAELQIEDDSILDLVQRQLVLDGRRVDLTKLEFDVIAYLHERKGTVVERSDLLRDVWGYEYAGGSNVIEANVRSLRKKLGDRADSIETIRGLGYRFGAPG
jgi:Transcriptional regulatory protein, C terminal/AAA ATPase domain